jgi:hypothetical protein
VSETLASTSDDFVNACVLKLANAAVGKNGPSIEKLNASLALVAAIDPRDELEATLAIDMAITHDLSIEMMQRAKTTTDRGALRDYANLATKFSRTFTAQMKAISEHRRGGEQVVRHVHVYDGGQAVLAETVNVGGSGNGRMHDQPYGPGAALPCPDPSRDAMPIPCDPRAETVPAPRVRARKRRPEG